MTRESRATTELVRLADRVELLTVDEVAQVLKVPKSTLYQWSYQGDGPPVVRVGRHLRYPRDLLNAWITSGMKVRRVDR